MSAAERWSDTLAEWAIPQEILDVAPESPWGFPSRVFAQAARDALAGPPSLTHQRARDSLPPSGGVVLDVGAGVGAASLPLAPPAGRVVAVDESAAMLDKLAQLARGRVAVELIEGRWPDVAERVAPVDVVVCAHVVYNVAALGEFVAALHARARRRVVVEFTAVHPQAVLSPLWRHFWGLDRPSLPTADDALAAELREHVAQQIGALARPEQIRFTEALPKTRSGKIMRRLLREVASGSKARGDTTTLEDQGVLEKLAQSFDKEE